MHRERHDVLTAANGDGRVRLTKGRGYPNELQARQIISDEAERKGKGVLAEALGISTRYLRLMLYNERPPTHRAVLRYFGWSKIYEVAPENDV